jgi:hypothetical protein
MGCPGKEAKTARRRKSLRLKATRQPGLNPDRRAIDPYLSERPPGRADGPYRFFGPVGPVGRGASYTRLGAAKRPEKAKDRTVVLRLIWVMSCVSLTSVGARKRRPAALRAGDPRSRQRVERDYDGFAKNRKKNVLVRINLSQVDSAQATESMKIIKVSRAAISIRSFPDKT